MLRRYQRGFVRLRGSKQQVWYGIYREDVRTPAGIERRQRQVRLGTRAELPTKNAARNKLTELIGEDTPSAEMDMLFRELAERWKVAVGSTLKQSTLTHYANALRIYVVPSFGDRKIAEITHEDVQLFLNDQANKYSKSALRSQRVVLALTLGWAVKNDWLQKNPCTGIALPKRVGGHTVERGELEPEQITAIAGQLQEPYATLVLFLAATGLRIGEAIAVKWSDIQNGVLHVQRRIYDGDVDTVKSKRSERQLPLGASLIARMRELGDGEWIFRSREGTPVNPGNAMKRYVRPAAKKLGITIGGWHDFRHALSRKLQNSGVHPKVVSDILGHEKVNLAMDVYNRTSVQDFVQPLAVVANELLPNVAKCEVTA